MGGREDGWDAVIFTPSHACEQSWRVVTCFLYSLRETCCYCVLNSCCGNNVYSSWQSPSKNKQTNKQKETNKNTTVRCTKSPHFVVVAKCTLGSVTHTRPSVTGAADFAFTAPCFFSSLGTKHLKGAVTTVMWSAGHPKEIHFHFVQNFNW